MAFVHNLGCTNLDLLTTFRSISSHLTFHFHKSSQIFGIATPSKSFCKGAKPWERNCDMKHEVQRYLNVSHHTEKESLLPIPSRPRVYNYSVCSMGDTPPILTCYLWAAPTTSSARMCPAPDVNNSIYKLNDCPHVDTKPLLRFYSLTCVPTPS